MTPVVTQISWTNHLLIMSGCKSDEEHEFYIHLCIKENYSKRQLERQLDSGYYERYMPRYWSQNNLPYEVDFLIQRKTTSSCGGQIRSQHNQQEYEEVQGTVP